MPRQRKSRAEHELAGTVPQYVDQEPSAFRAGRPKMPKTLSEAAQQEWKRMVRELARRNTLTTVDSSALAIYCETHARWRACLEVLAKDGPFIETTWVDAAGGEHTKPIEHPASKLCSRLENTLRQFLKEFSATPASRDKSKPAQSKPKKDEFPEGSWGWMQQMKKKLDAGGNGNGGAPAQL